MLTLSLHRDATVAQIVVRALHAKLPMFVGNVLIGMSALFVLLREPLLAAVFPPALWLFQRTYRHHLRAEEERRIWQAFATRHRRPCRGTVEEDVVQAGLRGALDVFGARRVEIEMHRGRRPERVLRGRAGPGHRGRRTAQRR